MRVLQLIDHLGSGGAQQVVLDLARHLPQHGFEVDVAHLFAPNALHADLAMTGALQHDLATGTPYRPVAALDPRPVLALRRLLRQRRYDVVNAHLYIAPLHMAFSASGRQLEFVNTIHAHRAELPGYVFPSYRLTRHLTSAFVGDFACSIDELADVGIRGPNATYIPFGIDPVDPDPTSAARFRAEVGATDEDVVLLSVARLHKQRYLDTFIELAARLRGAELPVVLVLAGDGPDQAELERLAHDLEISDRVRFPGRRADLDVMFAGSDLYLSVSRDGDGGIAGLQATSAGLPCLSWDTAGSTRDVDELRDVDYLVTAGTTEALEHAAIRFVTNPELRRRIGDHARTTVRRERSASTMAARYAKLYSELLARRVASSSSTSDGSGNAASNG